MSFPPPKIPPGFAGKPLHPLLPTKKGREIRWWVQFDSGFICHAQRSNIQNGVVRDWGVASVYGIGITEPGIRAGNERQDQVWRSILYRLRYRASYRDCSICERWQTFKYFLEDMPDIPGYDRWLAGESVVLDKDLLDPGNREYRPGKVQFVSKKRNDADGLKRATPKGVAANCKQVLDLDSGIVFESIKDVRLTARVTSKTIHAGERFLVL